MNQKTRTFTGRIAAIVAVVLLLATVLTSCASQPKPTLPYNEKTFSIDTEEQLKELGLKPSELEKVAKIFSDAFSASTSFNAREALVAANRGYDMTVENFDPNGDYKTDKGLDIEAAKNVIKKANATAAEAKSENAFTDAELSNTDKKGILDRLNAKDVELLISAFRTDVTTEGAGFWDSILGFVGTILNWITNTLGFGNYVVGICIFAILIEIIMLPFSIRQQKNSIKQATLRPKEMAIKNKYKGRNDQPTVQKMQNEIQELYQRENFNPYNGCLPLLLQLPVIMALYYIVIDPLHYVLGQSATVSSALTAFATASPAAGGLGMSLGSNRGTIEMLSLLKENTDNIIDALGNFQYFNFTKEALASLENAVGLIPNFSVFGLNFGLTPDFTKWADGAWVLLLVPVLTFVTYFASSKLNRKFTYQPATNDGVDARQMACSNSMMDVTMPAMSTFFTMAVPAVIGVYWAFRSWVGLLKSFIMSRIMPLPTFSEEDYKAAECEMASKTKKKKSTKSGEVRAVRSLHYIDDEDFEDTRERGLARRAAIEEKEKQEQEEKAERNAKTPFGKATLKKDDRAEETATDAPAEDDSTEQTVEDDNNKE